MNEYNLNQLRLLLVVYYPEFSAGKERTTIVQALEIVESHLKKIRSTRSGRK